MMYENAELKQQVTEMASDFKNMSKTVDQLHAKDTEVQRMIFGVNSIDSNVWDGGIGGHDKYQYLSTLGNTGEFLKENLKKVDKLKRQLDMQKKSLDSLYNLAIKREQRLASVPSIKPVRPDKMKKDLEYLSGFGIRLHPVHKVNKFHKGIDFTAPQGTPIMATGDGVIVEAGRRSGFGNEVLINHGFGFKTLYGHMLAISVKKGQKVKKGQQIGTVGSTGISTAPHCHYEVHINGTAVNPVDYVLDGLTAMEYKEIVKKASQPNQSWD